MKRFDLFISHDIALRWSANRWLAVKSINIWLHWSRSTELDVTTA
jgi:hypothetical protein